jgi:hypothetical protein
MESVLRESGTEIGENEQIVQRMCTLTDKGRKIKDSIKLSLHVIKYHTENKWVSGGIAPCILNLISRWR